MKNSNNYPMNGENFTVLKDNKGITLIEMLLVISIFSILLSIPILNSKYILSFIEKKEINELVEDIYNARNRALLESTIYSIDFLVNKNSYAVYSYERYKTLIKRKELKGGLRIKGIHTSNNTDEIRFSYLGVPLNSGTIYLINGKGEEIRISITPVTTKVNVYKD